jgi:hypothetical protein
MGIDYLDVANVEELELVERDNGKMEPATAVRPCYRFYLKRSIGDITENYATGPSIPFPSEQDYEKVDRLDDFTLITIAKEGIIEFYWGPPTKVVETESENTALLKFEDVQDVFRSQIVLSNLQSELDIAVANYDLEVLSRTITISEARLGMMPVSRQLGSGEYLMVPVWDFYGYESLKVADPEDAKRKQFTINENGEYVNRQFGKSFLTLNAVDGSVISRVMGY